MDFSSVHPYEAQRYQCLPGLWDERGILFQEAGRRKKKNKNEKKKE
jgi:hypothetical protein